MKLILLSLSVLAMAVLPSCTESEASAASTERPPENGAQFKKGEGLSLTDEMAKSIGLQTGDVEEQKIVPRLKIALQPSPGTKEATGWVTASQAEKIQRGQVVEFLESRGTKGKVSDITKHALSGLVDFEITITTETAMEDSKEVEASVVLPEAEAAASIPRRALLSTAEGHFVYATNGSFFLRTPIKVGAMNDDHAEVTEGLYAGDVVVTAGVTSLWMAELQVLRGGKACTCGH